MRNILHSSTMNRPAMTSREAKEFLIAQIVAEAELENVPLDDVERRMLYFTETAWMPEGTWDANAEFTRTYDQDSYEAKVATLISNACQRNRATASKWRKAIATLEKED